MKENTQKPLPIRVKIGEDNFAVPWVIGLPKKSEFTALISDPEFNSAGHSQTPQFKRLYSKIPLNKRRLDFETISNEEVKFSEPSISFNSEFEEPEFEEEPDEDEKILESIPLITPYVIECEGVCLVTTDKVIISWYEKILLQKEAQENLDEQWGKVEKVLSKNPKQKIALCRRTK